MLTVTLFNGVDYFSGLSCFDDDCSHFVTLLDVPNRNRKATQIKFIPYFTGMLKDKTAAESISRKLL